MNGQPSVALQNTARLHTDDQSTNEETDMRTDRIPVEVVDGFVVCFTAHHEAESMRAHFIGQCGWDESDYNDFINEDFDWFVAEVSVWRNGEALASEWLGACYYAKAEDFYTTYRNDYYADMRQAALDEAKRVHQPFAA